MSSPDPRAHDRSDADYKDPIKNRVAKKMSYHEKMESKGYRYIAAPAPRPSMSHEDRVKYYKENKGRYVKSVIGKDGKYVTPKTKKKIKKEDDWFEDNTDIEHTY